MKISVIDPISVIILEDVFTEKEQKEIFSELCGYVKDGRLLTADQTYSATYEDGSLKKKNSAIYLDKIYSFDQRIESAILMNTEKILLSYGIKNDLQNYNLFYGILKLANNHFTLVNYYEDSDYYDFHHDASAFSTLSFFFEEPKKFSGGNVIFKVDNKEFEVDIKNNMSIFFPSFYEHKVVPIKMNSESNKGSVSGRFSIAQFIFVVP
jgi:Rps23 Pro-64 3,4-dihydroxylase Tpa1-like proline 4-hydroxylase